MMSEMRILSPTAILGYGFPRDSFERGLAAGPDAIAVDAGSTDPGPAYLGSGTCFVARQAVRRDLEILITSSLDAGIPLLIGTAGGSGAKPHVDWCVSLIDEVLTANRLRARVARIYSDVPKETVRRALRDDRIRPLPFGPPITDESVGRASSIVAQIGVEPILRALEEPVDIVVAGRAYDPAIFAALPIRSGFDPGLATHMGKVLECAAIAATPGSGRDCVIGTIDREGFVLDTLSPLRNFTEESVAAHTLYEKAHPFRLPGPGGCLDVSGCRFRQVSDSAVEVTGSRFDATAPYTLKLEGAALVGYRTIAIAGVRDRIMIKALDEVFDGVRSSVQDSFGSQSYQLNFRIYGKDGVMGPLEPEKAVSGHEVGIVFDVVAPTQDVADTICGLARSTALHYGYSGRIATAGNLAFPFSPSDISAGPVYEFNVYHLMEVDEPENMFPVERLTMGENGP